MTRHFLTALCGIVFLAGCGGGAAALGPLPQTAAAIPQVYVALGDSITALGSPTPYVALINPAVIDLAISGETAVAAVIDELPKVPASATFVTVFLGENDLSRAWETGETVAQYAAAMQTIVSGIKSNAPHARIIVLNLPNYPWQNGGMVPYNAALAALGVQIVDTYSDAAYLNELQTTPVGNIHPTAVGNQELASLVSAAL